MKGAESVLCRRGKTKAGQKATELSERDERERKPALSSCGSQPSALAPALCTPQPQRLGGWRKFGARSAVQLSPTLPRIRSKHIANVN